MALSAGQIVETAYRLLQEYGLQDVSMRRIAAALEVRPGALYYHVSNKQQLLHRVAEQVLAPLDQQSRQTADPLELMAQLREMLLGLRDGGDLMLIAYSLDSGLPPVPQLRQALRQQGYSEDEAADRAEMLMRSALGAIAVEQNAQLFGREDSAGAERYAHTVQLLLR